MHHRRGDRSSFEQAAQDRIVIRRKIAQQCRPRLHLRATRFGGQVHWRFRPRCRNAFGAESGHQLADSEYPGCGLCDTFTADALLELGQ
jgi:hypothetical protein